MNLHEWSESPIPLLRIRIRKILASWIRIRKKNADPRLLFYENNPLLIYHWMLQLIDNKLIVIYVENIHNNFTRDMSIQVLLVTKIKQD